jgi:bifunctional non-homologous end joining protein LigD
MAADDLVKYRKKRDFSKTAEPAGGSPVPSGNRFVVHKHWATADHYDLRLEHNGVLKSWAVPKGPSLNPADKRFAAETEDHPIEYIDFEGLIPEGEYGGGPMIVWDTGVWAPMEDIDTSLAKGAFKFRLAGEKLRGGWMLARLKMKKGEDKPGWILFKEHDPAMDTETDILVTRPESVKSGRLIEELIPPKPKAPPKPEKQKPGAMKGAVKAAMPAVVKPQLATPSATPPSDEKWLHEIKFDGYRTLAHFSGGAVKLITRAGLDWTHRYSALSRAFAKLPCTEAVIDGEVVVIGEDGITRFAALQDALATGESRHLTFYAFDLIHLDGFDLSRVELLKRKEMLAKLLAPIITPNAAIQLSDHVVGDGAALYDYATELGLEGVVSKRTDAHYVQTRAATWLKTKALQKGDFPIVGYTTSEAAEGLAALGVGEWVDGELHYRGKVGTGFDAGDLASLLERLEPLAEEGPPLDRMPAGMIQVRPVLTAHVHYANLTRDDSLRHAVFKGLREPEITESEDTPERVRLISDADLASISITNPTRRLFGKAGPTKLDLAVYYAMVGDFMLPHLFNRPVSLIRSPTGKAEDSFYQRHPFTGMPKTVGTFESTSSEGEVRKYLTIEDAKAYLALAQFGVVEFHTWGCRQKTLEKPDRIVFDLDPGEGITWRSIKSAAFEVKAALEAMGLNPFVKTSGGKGLHIVVPIIPRQNWKQVHAATGAIASGIANARKDTFTAVMGKTNRKRLIFIDFHRNIRGSTAAAPYSLRSRANLPASTPVNWNDLESIDAPEDLNYSSLPGILDNFGDPWAAIDNAATDLPSTLKLPK